MIGIRWLGGDDWAAYRDIRLESLKMDPDAFGSAYEEELQFSKKEWSARASKSLAAFSGDHILGILTLALNNRPKHRHVAEIYGVYVRGASRGTGVGSSLMEAAMEMSKKHGAKKVKVDVNPHQKAALRLYLKYGFKEVGRLRKELMINGRFYDVLMLEKFI